MKTKAAPIKPLHISILSLFSHPFYLLGSKKTGGAERRAYYWLTILHQAGYPVSAILAHRNHPRKHFRSALKASWPLFEHPKYGAQSQIVRAPKPKSSFKEKLRDKVYRILGLPLPNSTTRNHWLSQGIYENINADVYVTFGVTNASNDLARYCAEYRKHFIVCAIHDLDFDFLEITEGKDIFDNKRWLKRETLDLASLVVAQSKNQLAFLKQAGIAEHKTTYIPNPISVYPVEPRNSGEYVLWIGRFDSNKNPRALLDLASKLPGIKFKMILSGTGPSIKEKLELDAIKNIEVINGVAPDEIRVYYLDALCLLSTAFLEGFPNTFLEAWEAEIPVAALFVNTDNLLTDYGLGFWANGDVLKLQAKIEEWNVQPILAREIGQRARNYVIAHHEKEKVGEQILKSIAGLTNRDIV